MNFCGDNFLNCGYCFDLREREKGRGGNFFIDWTCAMRVRLRERSEQWAPIGLGVFTAPRPFGAPTPSSETHQTGLSTRPGPTVFCPTAPSSTACCPTELRTTGRSLELLLTLLWVCATTKRKCTQELHPRRTISDSDQGSTWQTHRIVSRAQFYKN